MIITTIKMHGRSEKRKEIIQTVRGLADLMTESKGCVRADLYLDLEDKDILYLMEEWQTKKDLEKYKKSKSMAVLHGLEALLVESLEIKHAIKCRPAESNNL